MFDSGRKNFERCAIKKISSERLKTANYATLNCAVTGPDGLEFYNDSSRNTLEALAIKAGASLCRSCVYAGMPRDAYLMQRRQEADSEILLLESELRVKHLKEQLATPPGSPQMPRPELTDS